jgi:Putative binding domain, N-terminal
MNIARCCGLAVLIWAADVSIAEAQCSYSLNPTSFTVDAIASSRTVSVISGTSCSWTATTSTSWITITNGTGTGIGSVTFSVAQNATGSPRTGTLTVGGQTVTVNQGTGGCTGTVTPLSFAVDAIASSRTVSVIAGTACSWTATTTTSWITVTAGASGSGIGSVTFSIGANTTGASRIGTLTVAGQTVTVTQGATGCSATLTPASFDVDALATSRTLSVTSGTSCSWTATTATSWITVTAGASGSGIGSVTFSVAANTTGTSRNGTLNVAGQSVAVSQAAGATLPAAPTNLRIIR